MGRSWLNGDESQVDENHEYDMTASERIYLHMSGSMKGEYGEMNGSC